MLLYTDACGQWPDLFQPPSDRIDDDDDAAPLPAQLRAAAVVRQHELRCFACGEVGADVPPFFLVAVIVRRSAPLTLLRSLVIERPIVRILAA